MTVYRVTRFCCRRGNCIVCRALGDLAQRKRVVHVQKIGKNLAQKYAAGLKPYDAKIEEMEDA